MFELVPSTNQVVFEGDKLQLECHVSESDIEMNVTWIHDGEMVEADHELSPLLYKRRLPDRIGVTTLVIEQLNAAGDSGNWTCRVETALGTSELSIEIVILSWKTVYCPPEVTNSNRGQYVWPSTIAGVKQIIPCSAGAAPDVDRSMVAAAQRICDSAGNWQDADVSQCRYVSKTTQALEDYLLVSMQKVCWKSQLMSYMHTHTHTVLMSVIPGEPGLATCTLDFLFLFIPRQCILVGLA